MRRWRTPIIWLIVVCFAALLGWRAYSSWYVAPRDRILRELETKDNQNAQFEARLAQGSDLRRRFALFSEGMLGGQPDEADHRLRLLLREAAETAGLERISVSTNPPRGQANPFANARLSGEAPRLIARRLEERPDFGVFRASVTGQGGHETLAHLISLLESQPWVDSIPQWSIRPIGDERRRFEVRADITALYEPRLAGEAEREVVQEDPTRAEARLRLASVNRFRPPPPPPQPETQVAQEDPPAEQPAPPPPPPRWERWRVAGIFEGTELRVVVMLDGDRPATRSLSVGDSLFGARLVGADVSGGAWFEIDGDRFVVPLNRTLANRRPAP
ncbi:MAG: hypothetical protein JJU33_09905 [Phycisphaerales bacterium]|nr:hypothetical protein [Phycisphaerales bacterium]